MTAKEILDAAGDDPSRVRWFLYCIANGNQPSTQLKADEVKYPADPMTGFTLWLNAHSDDFKAANPVDASVTWGARQAHLTEYLAERALEGYLAALKARETEHEPVAELAENAA